MSFKVIHAFASNVSADSTEGKELIRVLKEFYRAIYDAEKYGAVDEFDNVLVDLPEKPYSDDQKKMVEGIYGSDAAANSGYRTAMKAMYLSWWNGRQKGIELLAKAKSENRELTGEDKREIVRAENGEFPPSFYGIDKTFEEPNFIIVNIELNGNRAVVRYETLYSVEDAFFIQIDNKWYIYDDVAIKTKW